jgi:hypothetical protein
MSTEDAKQKGLIAKDWEFDFSIGSSNVSSSESLFGKRTSNAEDPNPKKAKNSNSVVDSSCSRTFDDLNFPLLGDTGDLQPIDGFTANLAEAHPELENLRQTKVNSNPTTSELPNKHLLETILSCRSNKL